MSESDRPETPESPAPAPGPATPKIKPKLRTGDRREQIEIVQDVPASNLPPPTRKPATAKEPSALLGLVPPLLFIVGVAAIGLWYAKGRSERTDALAEQTRLQQGARAEAESARRERAEMSREEATARRETEAALRARGRELIARAEAKSREVESALAAVTADKERRLAEVAAATQAGASEATRKAEAESAELAKSIEELTRQAEALKAENESMRAWLKTHNRTLHRTF